MAVGRAADAVIGAEEAVGPQTFVSEAQRFLTACLLLAVAVALATLPIQVTAWVGTAGIRSEVLALLDFAIHRTCALVRVALQREALRFQEALIGITTKDKRYSQVSWVKAAT